MLKSNSTKKILSGILIATIISVNFSVLLVPRKAKAQISVNIMSSSWEVQKTNMTFLLRAAAKRAIIFFAQAVADWIKGGFQGNPSFLNDPARFATNIADVVIGDFIYNDPSFSFLCKPFQLQLKLSIALQHRKFYQTVDCTLSGVVNNVEDAYNNFASGDFINGGGWDNFLTIVTDPNATPEGAFLVFDSELTLRGQDKQGQVDKELQQGQGSLSFRSCTDTTYNIAIDSEGNTTKQVVSQAPPYVGSPFYRPFATTSTDTITQDDGDTRTGTSVETVCKITTPGNLITQRLFFGSTSGQRMTEMQVALADGLDIIISATTELLTEMAVEQMGKLTGALTGSTDQQYYDNDQTISDLQNQQNRQATQNSYNSSSNVNSINNTDPVSSKGAALNNQRNIESNYKTTQTNILNYLNGIDTSTTTIRGTFIDARSCFNINRVPASAGVIQDVLNAIPGTEVFKRLNNNITSAENNISTIDSRISSLSASTQTNDLNSAPFHTEQQASDISSATDIYNQAVRDGNTYQTSVCPITIPTLSQFLLTL